jgi:23S rRNA pseudouridine1911/1915/1917 synthase
MADQESAVKQKYWVISNDQAGLRLDAFLRQVLPHLSRREAERAIEEKLFSVSGRQGHKGQRLAAADTVTFMGPAQWLSEAPLPNPHLEVPILYEDSCLLVLDKPAGMDTHGFSARDDSTLANFLVARRPEVQTIGKSRWEPGLIHRIDRDTSGLVLVAKTQASFEQLRLQFRRRQIKKSYWALVWGITAAEGDVAYPLAHDPQNPRRMQAITGISRRKRQKSWQALTRFRKVKDSRGLSLLKVEMESGVTHQIRAHLSAIGHPIVGDALYGAENRETFGLQRQFLHAAAIEFHHPESGQPTKIKSELPDDLKEALKHAKMDF